MPYSFFKSPLTRTLRWLLGSAIVLLTLISLLSLVAWHPYLELTSHFKVQYLLASSLLLGLLVPLGLLRQRNWLLVTLFCLTLQLVEVVPWYFPPAGAIAPQPHNLRILLSNLYVQNKNPDKILALIAAEKPDIAVFQERDGHWLRSLEPLKAQMPYIFEAPEDIAVFSRIPLENPTLFGSEQHSISATITVNNHKALLVTTHPLPPLPRLAKFRNAELKQVTDYVKNQKAPVVLIGDLNTTMWSPYYKRLKSKTGLKNARQGFGILPTWPAPTQFARTHPAIAALKPLLWIPIDHCLVSPEIQIRDIRVGANIDSDHLPLMVDLFVPS